MSRFCLQLVAGTLAWMAAGVPLWADEGIAFFEKQVRSILIERCYDCHSEQSGKSKGGLLLDRRAGWAEGGDTGPALVPGKPEISRLVHAVRYTDEDLQMPPKSRIPDTEIKILEQWVAMGAPDPRDAALAGAVRKGKIDYEAARKGWAFRSLAPAGKSIDQHLAEGFAEAGVEPVGPATPRERLRRLYYDLIGLPPSIEEVEKFDSDPSGAAWAKIVDDLLGRPGFGETWGRHWLDVVRYADSNGGDRNFSYYQAWRYRNWVIEAFNQDKSYYTFVAEQVAGDLLPWEGDAQRHEQLVGSTFLALGPKMLTERDKEKLRMDVADEQVDTLGRAFLGMTIGCARCHDHKFDPISQEEYYGLVGIMRSTQVVLGTRNGCVNVASWVEQALPEAPEKVQHKLEAMELVMRLAVEKLYREKSGGKMVSMDIPFAGVIIDDADAELFGEWKTSTYLPLRVGEDYRHDDKAGKGEKKAVFRASLPENGRYEVRLSYNADDRRATNVPVTVHAEDGLHHVSVNQTVMPRVGDLFEPVGQFYFEKGAIAEVTISTKGTAGYVIVDAVQFVPVADLERETAALAMHVDGSETNSGMKAFYQMSEKELKDKVKTYIKELSAAEVVMAPRDAVDAGDVHLRVRGVVSQKGPLVARGFLQAVGATEVPVIPDGESGRLGLAEWLTGPENSLLDRIMVNRIWHHLMGEGLVRTVDNFGALGDQPSHPALLDDLAAQFRKSKGSIKSLVAAIAKSQAYQRSSLASDTLTNADPENRLWGRQNRHRLSAEALRDSIFLLTEELGRERKQSTIKNSGEDLDGKMDHRRDTYRAVYLPVARNNAFGELHVFDVANPDLVHGARTSTTVPTQALFLLNSELMIGQSQALAKLARAHAEIPEAQVDWLYRRVYQRNPQEQERADALAFIHEAGAARGSAADALDHFAQILLASTEFQFID